MRLLSPAFVLLILIFNQLSAIADNWVHHIPFAGVDKIIETSSRVYYTSLGALFAYDKKNDETLTLSPHDILNDVDVTGIYSIPSTDAVVVAYRSGNIDIIRDDSSVLNLPDIKISQLNPRNINHIAIIADFSAICVATDFGIVLFDIHKGEVRNYCRFSAPVSHVAFIGSTPIAVIQKSLYVLRSGKPFGDTGSWVKIQTPPIENICPSGSGLFLLIDSGEQHIPASCHIDLNTFTADLTPIRALSGIVDSTPISDNSTAFFSSSQIHLLDASGALVRSVSIPSAAQGSLLSASAGLGHVWSGNSDGLACFDLESSSPVILIDRFRPGEMSVSDVNMLRFAPSGALYIASRGNSNVHINRTTGNLGRICRLSTDGTFQDLTPTGLSHFFEKQDNPDGRLFDITFIREDPDNLDIHYAGALLEGMYALDGRKEVCHFYLDNTPFLDNWGVRIMDIAFDPRGGLWAYSEAPDDSPMICFLPPEARNHISDISRDDWIPIPFTSGVQSGRDCTAIMSADGRYIYSMGSADIYVYDTAGTLSLADDSGAWARSFISSDAAASIPVSRVCSIMEDPDNGALWIGTDIGVLVAPQPFDIHDGAISVYRPKVSRNDGSMLADYLLANERIYGITTDPLGNKWIATEASGAFLVSNDGTQILLNFTSSNSPLPTNEVRAIACANDGTVYFGSVYGLLEYHSDYTPGADNFSDVRIYPNPVRPDFLGDIIIDGLIDGSTVLIVSSSGALITKLKSEGGRIRWNPRHGNYEIPAGIYHVLASGPGNSGQPVGKIAIIR